jgi:hypothetical protein
VARLSGQAPDPVCLIRPPQPGIESLVGATRGSRLTFSEVALMPWPFTLSPIPRPLRTGLSLMRQRPRCTLQNYWGNKQIGSWHDLERRLLLAAQQDLNAPIQE